jgi:hypothetical protein
MYLCTDFHENGNLHQESQVIVYQPSFGFLEQDKKSRW